MNATAIKPRPQPPAVEPFPVAAPAALPVRDEATRWLVEGLCPTDCAAVIGGSPKLGKTWLALELAIAVAGRVPCLGHFPVPQGGRVLLFCAEDSLPDLRARLEGLCRARRLHLDQLDLGVLTIHQLRLDVAADRQRLAATIAVHKPALLILDPFVRLQRAVDENSATEVSAILGELRALQRRFHTAIALVHHAKKNGGHLRPGLTLRGSGDFFAFADVTLSLHRKKAQLWLSVEQRSAPSPEPFPVQLVHGGRHRGPHLQLNAQQSEDQAGPPANFQPNDLHGCLIDALAQADRPMSQARIRAKVKARNASVGQALKALAEQGRVQRSSKGWSLISTTQTSLL